MMHQADFKDGKILFEEIEPKPVDTSKLQAAMFVDRPDLWRKPIRKKRQPSQPKLI